MIAQKHFNSRSPREKAHAPLSISPSISPSISIYLSQSIYLNLSISVYSRKGTTVPVSSSQVPTWS